MKKLIALLLCAAMLCLAGCGTEETPATTTEAPAPSGTTEAPAPSTTQATEPSAETQAQTLDLEALYNDCLTYMPEMIALDEDMMLNFCGIEAEDCAQAYVAICADGLRADEIWLIEATDAQALERLLDMVDARIQAKDEESVTYSPAQNAVVKDARIITAGNYLAVLVSPDADTLEAQVNGIFSK